MNEPQHKKFGGLQLFGWSGALRRLVVLFACCLPITTDFYQFGFLSSFQIRPDFSSGETVVPIEEIYFGHVSDSDAEVVRHALRIIEQHYVQREKLNVVRMINSAIRAVSREHGGDVEVALFRRSDLNSTEFSSNPSVRLCSDTDAQIVRFCEDERIVALSEQIDDSAGWDVLLRAGLRVFSVGLSGDNSLRVLDLVGRFVVPEYARYRRVDVSSVVHTFVNGLLDQLDPHSSYMTQDEYRELRSGTRGNFGGVGLVVDELQELPVIREVVPNSPAQMAGVRPGDVLLKVGNSISAFYSLDSVVNSIRDLSSDAATPIWFFRPVSRRVYRAYLAREEIPTRSAELRNVVGRPDVLHIRVTGFSNHTAEEVYSLYEQAQLTARGRLKLFVLDLRGNPGGLLDQAIQLTDLFIRQGQIVSTRSRFEEQVELASRGSKIDLPVVVLMNSSSASASEIVAGALKDHGRALLVGERTFGKGSVQSLFELSTGTALKLTVAHYFTPLGRSLQGIGVEPHVNVKLVQPREGFLWMSGSSEIDREEHLVAHLSNPVRKENRLFKNFSDMSTHLWALSPPEENSIAALSPINFAYPLGDNTQTLLRTEEDAVARVGIAIASRLFRDRKLFHVFSEDELRDAHKQVAAQEVQTIRSSIRTHISDLTTQDILFSYFDSLRFDDSGVVSGEQPSPQVTLDDRLDALPSLPGEANEGGLSKIFFDIWNRQSEGNESEFRSRLGRVSLSAQSLLAWQDASRFLLSLNVRAADLQAQRGEASALLGLRLDDLHDGPTVWIPVRFSAA
ncbi:MAG: carboxy-terminal-processing protease precursor, partial [Pseudomonadota bacterium]